jgi:hypothetical protein
MHVYTGQEDGSLADSLVLAIYVAACDIAGDGLSGHGDNDVYPMDAESRKLFSLSTSKIQSTLIPEVLSQ